MAFNSNDDDDDDDDDDYSSCLGYTRRMTEQLV